MKDYDIYSRREKFNEEKKALGPDEGLAKEQIVELNQEFYSEYFEDYFKIRLLLLGEITKLLLLFFMTIMCSSCQNSSQSTTLNSDLLMPHRIHM